MPADTVSVLNRPEWPVAGLFLERFLLMLKSERGLESSATAMRQVRLRQRSLVVKSKTGGLVEEELPSVVLMAGGVLATLPMH